MKYLKKKECWHNGSESKDQPAVKATEKNNLTMGVVSSNAAFNILKPIS